MQNRKNLENYLRNGHWSKADEWLYTELCFVHGKLIRRRIVCHSFGILMTLVLALLTWGVVFPDCKAAIITEFPFAILSQDLFRRLCAALPGGTVTAVIGLLLLPILVASMLALVFCRFQSKRYAKKIETTAKQKNSHHVEEKIALLDKMYNRYNDEYFHILMYYLLGGVLVGLIMVFASVPEGANLSGYILAGIVCAGLYGLAFFACIYGIYRLYERNRTAIFNPYDCRDWILMAKGEYVYSKEEEEYPDTSIFSPDYETEEERIRRIVLDVEDDLSGGGYGNY